MTTPTPNPTPGPYFTSVTGSGANGQTATVQPSALREYATLATANGVLQALQFQVPECGPFTLVDINASSTVAWSQPMYGIQALNSTIFNAGLLYAALSQGGYNAMLAIQQVRQAVLGY